MVTASTHAIGLAGIEGHAIRIDAAITGGPAGLVATGLPDTTVRQTGDRVRAAIINSGYAWPDGQITVTVGPAEMPNHGSSLDLGIAIAILAAAGSVPTAWLGSLAFIGELGMDGRLRPVPGVLPAAAAAAHAGYAAVMVRAGNRAEALLAEGIRVIAPDSLRAAVEVLTGEAPVGAPSKSGAGSRPGAQRTGLRPAGGAESADSTSGGGDLRRWSSQCAASGQARADRRHGGRADSGDHAAAADRGRY